MFPPGKSGKGLFKLFHLIAALPLGRKPVSKQDARFQDLQNFFFFFLPKHFVTGHLLCLLVERSIFQTLLPIAQRLNPVKGFSNSDRSAGDL